MSGRWELPCGLCASREDGPCATCATCAGSGWVPTEPAPGRLGWLYGEIPRQPPARDLRAVQVPHGFYPVEYCAHEPVCGEGTTWPGVHWLGDACDTMEEAEEALEEQREG